MIHDETETPKFRFGVQAAALSDAELRGISNILDVKEKLHPHFCRLVRDMLRAERERRSQPGREPECYPMPELSVEQMACCIMGAYVFPRLAWTQPQARFIDDVAIHLTAAVATLLQAAAERDSSDDE